MIDLQGEQVFIYRADDTTEHIPTFNQVLSGEDVLKSFELKLSELVDED